MAYLDLKGKFIIQTNYGCYTENGWCYITDRNTKEEAINWVKNMRYPEEFRVVDYIESVIYWGMN